MRSVNSRTCYVELRKKVELSSSILDIRCLVSGLTFVGISCPYHIKTTTSQPQSRTSHPLQFLFHAFVEKGARLVKLDRTARLQNCWKESGTGETGHRAEHEHDVDRGGRESPAEDAGGKDATNCEKDEQHQHD